METINPHRYYHLVGMRFRWIIHQRMTKRNKVSNIVLENNTDANVTANMKWKCHCCQMNVAGMLT